METKILGIILSIVGIAGLILALIYMNDAVTSTTFSILIACGVLGAITFFVGIRLVPHNDSHNKPVKIPTTEMSELSK
jgi:hypothetical protein